VNLEFQNSAHTALVRVFSGHQYIEQEVSNSLLALASMGVSWDSLPSDVKHALIAAMVSSQTHNVQV
jgi:hypothetical protein